MLNDKQNNMTIVKSPLFDGLWDKLGGLEFRRRRNKKIELAKKRVPTNPRTFKQKVVRLTYRQGLMQYHQLTDEEKAYYVQKYRKENLDAYRAFMKEWLSQNLPKAVYEITIDNSANQNELTDYQVLLNISGDSQFFQDCQNNPCAFYFMNEELTTKIPFYRELWDTVNYNARIWLKVPSIPAQQKVKLYMLINPNRTESLSNPEHVFDFFDDFEGTELDTTKWNVKDATGFSISNSLLKGTNTLGVIHSITSFTPQTWGYSFEVLLKPVANAANGFTAGGFYKSATDGLTYLKHPNNDYIRNNGTWNSLGSEKMALNVFHKLIITAKPDGTVDVKVIRTDTGVTTYQATWTNTVSDEVIRLGRRADDNFTGQAYEAYWDWVRVRKYTEPEPNVTYTKL